MKGSPATLGGLFSYQVYAPAVPPLSSPDNEKGVHGKRRFSPIASFDQMLVRGPDHFAGQVGIRGLLDQLDEVIMRAGVGGVPVGVGAGNQMRPDNPR